MKKIVYIIGQLGLGGAERQLYYLTSKLNHSKFQIKVVSLSEDVGSKFLFDESGIEVVIIPKVINPDFTRPYKLYKIIHSFQPDLIHSYLSVANFWSRIIGFLLKIPVIISERSLAGNKELKMILLNRLISPLGEHLIANSKKGAETIINNKEFSKKKISVIYNGIPFEKFNQEFTPQKKNLIRSKFNIPLSSKVIGIIGSLQRAKNHELLFNSFSLVLKQIPESYLLCVGDGPRKELLITYVKEHGVKNRVIFAGARNDIPECLSIMDVMVLPSRWEGMPNVILEAMAAQCPVIATNVGGVGELIIDGETGFLVNSYDKYELTQKILIALTDKKLITEIKQKALRFVRENFSIDKMVEETVTVYNKVLSTKNYEL